MMTLTTSLTTTTRATTTLKTSAPRTHRPRARVAVLARASDDATSTESTRRRALVVLTSALVAATSPREARAYGTGGWRDCEPVCDSLKNGREEQLRLQREMMASMGGDASASASAADAKKDAIKANGGRIPRKTKK
jgi:hypothetical protein